MSEEKKNRKLTLYGIAGSVAIAVGGYFLYQSLKHDENIEDNECEAIGVIQSSIMDTKDTIIERRINPTQNAIASQQNGIRVEHDTEQIANEVQPQLQSNTLHVEEDKLPEFKEEKENEIESKSEVIAMGNERDLEMITEQHVELSVENEATPDSDAILITKSEDDKDDAEEERAFTPNSIEKVQTKEQIEKQIQDENELNELIAKYSKIADETTQLKQYQYKDGMLRVKVVKASNIGKSRDSRSRWCNAVVELKLRNNENYYTKLIKNKKNPRWNELFEFNVSDAVRDHLECVLYDNEIHESKFIGRVIVNVIDVAAKNGFLFGQFAVLESNNDIKLFLELTYEETSVST